MFRHRRTPLHVACELGHAPVVRLLLDAKANMEAIDDKAYVSCITGLFLLCAKIISHLLFLFSPQHTLAWRRFISLRSTVTCRSCARCWELAQIVRRARMKGALHEKALHCFSWQLENQLFVCYFFSWLLLLIFLERPLCMSQSKTIVCPLFVCWLNPMRRSMHEIVPGVCFCNYERMSFWQRSMFVSMMI